MKRLSYLLLLISLSYALPATAVTIQDLETGLTADQLVNTLLSDDAAVTVSNISITGDSSAVALFNGGLADGFDIDSGVMLSTGLVISAIGPNLSDGKSAEFNRPGDPDLNTLVPGSELRDAVALTFDFVPAQDGRLQFRYVFASEEYNEFVGAQSNDVFGFFLDGVNIATLGGQAVAINTVNKRNNSDLFNNNSVSDFTPPTPFATEFDGFTDALTAEAQVLQGVTYTIKLVIADAKDASFDSAVFLEQGAFQVNAVPVALFTVSPSATNPLQVVLDGSQSSDSDGSIAGYQWQSADGQTATGEQAALTFPTAGDYSIALTVTDNEGATATTQQNITLVGAAESPNTAPTANFSATVNAANPLQVDLNASASLDSDGNIVSYQWQSADGQTATGEQAALTFPTAGDYSIALTVTDNEGATATTQQSITLASPVVTPPVQQQATPESIPTLSEWAMIILVGLLLLIGVRSPHLRRE